jgi:hypothetical protein
MCTKVYKISKGSFHNNPLKGHKSLDVNSTQFVLILLLLMMKMPLLLSGNLLWRILFLLSWPLSLSNHLLCHIPCCSQLLKTGMWLLMVNDSTDAGVVAAVEPAVAVEELQLGTHKFSLLSNFLCLQR